MKLNKFIILIFSTIILQINGQSGDLCHILTEAFKDIPTNAQCSTRVNKETAKACIKNYLGNDTFKNAICPILISTFNRNDIKQIDQDITNVGPIAKSHMGQVVIKLKNLKDEYSKGSGFINALKLAAATTAYQIASGVSQLLNLNVIQDALKSVLASKRRPMNIQIPTTQEAQNLFAEEEEAEEKAIEKPEVEAQVARQTATSVAQDIAKSHPELSSKEVAQAIVEEIKDEGIPAAPPIGDLEDIINASQKQTPQIKIVKKPITAEVKKEIKMDTQNALQSALAAAIAKRRADLGEKD